MKMVRMLQDHNDVVQARHRHVAYKRGLRYPVEDDVAQRLIDASVAVDAEEDVPQSMAEEPAPRPKRGKRG